MDVELEALIWAISSARGSSSGSWCVSGLGGSSNNNSRLGDVEVTAPCATGACAPAQPNWTPDSLIAALDLALPDVGRGQQEEHFDAGWSDDGGADASGSSHSGSSRLASALLPTVVAPASTLHPPSSSLAWAAAAAPAEVVGWLDAKSAHIDLDAARSGSEDGASHGSGHTLTVLVGPGESDRPLLQLTSLTTPQGSEATAGRGAVTGVAGGAGERLMGPLAADGPELAGLMCAAAGVAWASQQPQQQKQDQTACDWTQAPVTALSAAASSFSALDPALEWALAVLSTWVSPEEPPAGDVRLANRTFAAHARRAGGLDAARPKPQSRMRAPGASVAGQTSLNGSEALPWQALQPLLAAVGNRLSPCSALALLQVLVRQVGRSWRQQQPGDASSAPLPAPQQQQVAATCQALFAAALRRPEQLPRATAAGLLVVMRRLQLHSPPTCALLVERLLAGPGTSGAAAGAATAAPGPADNLEATSEDKRLRLALRRGRGRRPASSTPLRLEWVAMALSCLAQLRVPAEALPRRAVTRLFRSAVAPANRRRWTPSLAAALLVWAARLRCRPPARALQLYMAGLVEARTGASRLKLLRRPAGSSSSSRMGCMHSAATSAAPAPSRSLLARMRGPQLMAVLEALWRLYGAEASPQAAAAAAAATGGRATSSGPPHRFQRRIAAALMARLHQLPRQQLCRLPLLLARLGLDSLRRPEHLRAFSVRVQQAASSCDVLDVLLLLRGLEKEARAELQPSGQQGTLLSGVAAPGGYCGWQRGELADVALRRYTVLLPSASPRFSAAALQALPLLWPPLDFDSVAAASAGAPAGSAEADLQLRRAADTAAERQWLLQQLDEHLAEALAAEAGRLGQAAAAASRRGGRRGGGGGGSGSRGQMDHETGVGRLVLQVLESHVALRRRPSQRLQAALEAAVVAVAPALGTSGCARVRAAYSDLGMTAGSRLSVALVTFG